MQCDNFYFQPLTKRGSLSYEDVLKDFLMSEDQYIRELNLIVKVSIVYFSPFISITICKINFNY